MAITPLPNVDKKFTFDGETSATYGVMILGEGVFNAPERDTEMVSIPGRNGAYILDNGRFENIEVTYPCTLIADNTADFADAISDFRNWLCSKTDYCRLEDDYNTSEYRMATYKSGLELEPMVLQGAEFFITFECKPQRYLTSGESAVSVTSGDTITNPTRFDAKPLLETDGYGDIDINGETINIDNGLYGDVLLANSQSIQGLGVTLDASNLALLDAGDTITVAAGSVFNFSTRSAIYGCEIDSLSLSSSDATVNRLSYDSSNLVLGSMTFQKGTAQTYTYNYSLVIQYEYQGNTLTYSNSGPLQVGYFPDDYISIYADLGTVPSQIKVFNSTIETTLKQVTGTSTKLVVNYPIFIDLDFGEAHVDINGTISGVNNIVTLPANLPVLSSGANTITYDNTFTSVKVTPRWWKV